MSYLPPSPSAYKSTDQAIANSTTLTNDTALTVNLHSGVKYRIRAVIFLLEVQSGMRFALNGTATFNSLKAQIIIFNTILRACGRVTAFGTAVTHSTQGGGDHVVFIDGTIEVNAGGTLVVQWAQDTSDATALTVQRNSYLLAEPVRAT
jgi:hypothetical protein